MKLKKILCVGFMITTLAINTIPVFAAAYSTPAEAAAGVTGRTVEDVIQERLETGKTYGTIAADAGKLEEFKEASLEMKKDKLDEQVSAGYLSQAEADAILEAIEARQATCNGTGNGSGGRGQGYGRGRGGAGRGAGQGGLRLQDGSCYYQ